MLRNLHTDPEINLELYQRVAATNYLLSRANFHSEYTLDKRLNINHKTHEVNREQKFCNA